MELDVKYPCGFEVHYKAGFLNTDTFRFDMSQCPLHGKECKKPPSEDYMKLAKTIDRLLNICVYLEKTSKKG